MLRIIHLEISGAINKFLRSSSTIVMVATEGLILTKFSVVLKISVNCSFNSGISLSSAVSGTHCARTCGLN